MRGLGASVLVGLLACATEPAYRAPALDASSHWNFSDPEGSRDRFRALAEELAGDAALEARTQAARAAGLLGDFEAARAELALVEDRLPGAGAAARVRHALETGRVLRSSGDPEAAIPHFERALNLAQDARLDGLAVDAMHMLGIVHAGVDGERWTRRGIAMAETSADPSARRWRPALWNNLGWSQLDAGRAEEALESFERALVLREERGEQEPIWIARWCVARCLRELGELDRALAMQLALEAEREAANSPDPYVTEELQILQR